jgi:Holliday junction DNA helicase RuvB
MDINPRKNSLMEQEDQEIDKALRPKRLKDFTGQEKSVENLEIFIQAAKL